MLQLVNEVNKCLARVVSEYGYRDIYLSPVQRIEVAMWYKQGR